MKLLPANEGLVVFDIRWATDTAGPSPDNNMRTELFLLGCKKAKEGNPCKGCFNSATWDITKAEHSRDPEEIADFIIANAPNKYITIGGGEPTDQIEKLMPLCKKLKENGFHIMMYTWRDLKFMIEIASNTHYIPYYYGTENYELAQQIIELIKYLDIVVDGQFELDERLYQEDLGDGMLSSIGSGNQKIWDIKAINENRCTYPLHMRDLVGLYVKPDNNELVYITKQ